jgi:hypothetical protein
MLIRQLLFLPEEANPSGSGSKESMIDFLNADDEKPDVIDLDKEDKGKDKNKDKEVPDEDDEDNKDNDKEDKEDKEDELSDFEDDEELPDDEELELITPVRKKEILKEYPDLFKKFPYLERAYYRDQQFTEVFQTPAEARDASEKSQALDNLEQTLIKGESKELLSSIKETDENGYYKFVDSFLPTLAEVDSRAYGTVIGNIIKHAVLSMVEEGKTSGNDDLQVAAQILYKYTFGNSKFEAPQRLAKPDIDKDKDPNKAAEEREAKIRERDFNRNLESINTSVNNSIKATIDANIDSKEQMSPYVKKQAAREAFETVSEILNNDKRLKQVLDALWEKAAKSDYTTEDMNAIRSAVRARARTVLPAALKKARIEALKGMGKQVREKEDDDTDTGNKRDSPPETHRRQKPVSRITSGKDIPRGMSTLDFLNSD